MQVQPAAHLHDGSGFAVLQEELTVLHERVQVDQEALQAAEEIVSHRLPRPPHQLLHLLHTDHLCDEQRQHAIWRVLTFCAQPTCMDSARCSL